MLEQLFKKEKWVSETPSIGIQAGNGLTLMRKQQRTKLWELDHNYQCAVIGTCLTQDEVKKLLRSVGMPVDDTSSYVVHTAIVTLVSYNDFRSKKVQSYLNN